MLDTLANSVDLDEMLHMAAFHQGLQCLLYDTKQFSEQDRNTSVYNFFTCIPLKYKMDNAILIVSICMG